MSIYQLNAFDKKDKLHKTLDRICEFEPPEGYYLAFSGGKDSQTVYHLLKTAGVKFDSHFNLTTVDPPEVVQFVKKNYEDVEIIRPEKSMWRLIADMGFPPTRIKRYCCRLLKEGGGEGRKCVTGIRWEESVKRSKRRMVESCFKSVEGKQFMNFIIDWETSEVWEYLNGNSIEHCQLYDEGHLRVGCIGCPMSGTKGMLRDFARWPMYERSYYKAFDRMLEKCIEKGRPWDMNVDEAFHWWVHNPPKGDPDQTIMLE